MATPTAETIGQGTLTTLLGSELNSVASGSYSSLGAAVNNVQATSNLNGYAYWDVLLFLNGWTGSSTAGGSINLWFIPAADGTNYDNSGTTISIQPDVIIPVDVLTGPASYQRTVRGVWAPVGLIKPIALNSGTGVALAVSGNTIKIRPTTIQSPSV